MKHEIDGARDVFLLWWECTSGEESGKLNLLGVFSSEARAKAAQMDIAQESPRFTSDGEFSIADHGVDRVEWLKGFVTVTSDDEPTDDA